MPLDQSRELQRNRSRRWNEAGIDDPEDAFAREHETGAGEPRNVG